MADTEKVPKLQKIDMIITVFLPVYRITEYFIMSYLINYLDDMLDYGSLYSVLLFLPSFVDKVYRMLSAQCNVFANTRNFAM